MIRIKGLTKAFDRRVVIDNVSLDIERGAVTAVLGPNASGKTTLIKCVLGLVNPDAGSILIDDEPVVGEWRYRAKIGYMPQIARFPDNLTVNEQFDMLKDVRRREFYLKPSVRKKEKQRAAEKRRRRSAMRTTKR